MSKYSSNALGNQGHLPALSCVEGQSPDVFLSREPLPDDLDLDEAIKAGKVVPIPALFLAPGATSLPAALTSRPRWTGWKPHDGSKLQLRLDGKAASCNEPGDWTSFDVASRAFWPKLSFALGGGIGVIDLDGCRDPETGAIAEWAKAEVERFQSYTEISPSGTGLHIFAAGAPTSFPNGKVILKKAMDGAGEGGKAPAVEAFVRSHFCTVTGQHLPGTKEAVMARPKAWADLASSLPPAVAQEEHSSTKAGGGTAALKVAPEPMSPDRVQKLQQRRPDVFDGSRHPSNSERDFALLCFACELRLSPEEAWALLVAVRADNKARDPKYFARTFEKAQAAFPVWWSQIGPNKQGNPLPDVRNAITILEHDPAFRDALRFDELRQAPVCQALPWDRAAEWRRWTDNDVTRLAAWFQDLGCSMSVDNAHRAAIAVAQDHAFNPVAEYLRGLQWDGKPRLDHLLPTYFGADGDDPEYLAAVGSMWMKSAVARVFYPGCKADHMLILEGGQGTTKSSALRALAGDDWFTDEVANMGTKDAAQDLHGKWIIEISELSAMKGAQIEQTKAFVSRQTDHYRPSYGRMSQDFPRRCVFVGTTNDEAYLKDQSGNRRYWPVKISRADVQAIRRDRDQLWAEAVARFQKGETWWLPPEQEALARDAQEGRRQVDPWEDAARKYADAANLHKGYITISGCLEFIGIKKDRQTKQDSMRVADIFQGIGLHQVPGKKTPPHVGVGRQRYYTKG
jgi:predicted P-loop ATPase